MRPFPGNFTRFSRLALLPTQFPSLIGQPRPAALKPLTCVRPLLSIGTFSPNPPEKPHCMTPNAVQGKRPRHEKPRGKPSKRLRRKKQKAAQDGSPEEVLLTDIQDLLAAQRLNEDEIAEGEGESEAKPLPEPGSEIEVEVIELSSTGDGLARQKGSDQIYVVPFAVPGDTVKVKVYRHLEEEQYTVADFISVVKPSALRDDSRIRCQYFAKCSGCQFQMLDYAEQLRLKRRIVERAYAHFSQLPPELVPAIQDTIGSPLQYGYRTKLTPHFDGPGGVNRRGGPKRSFEAMPPFGFTPKGQKRVLDIEDCPIGTDAVRRGLTRERARMAVEFGKYERGATILLRESTKRVPKSPSVMGEAEKKEEGKDKDEEEPDVVKVETDDYVDYKTCITDNNATSTEYIDDFIFTNPAGSFFQNNNSILSPFTAYIREHILPPPPSSASSASSASTPTPHKPIRTLIDAYSGSGLFTITQASLFPGGSIGIDIAEQSIAFARRNAALNGLVSSAEEKENGEGGTPRCRFVAADAPELFRSVADLDPDETVVVLDPPRKGCDASFLRQLLRFAPRRVVYVSCNVHTQARDVGVLVRGEVEALSSGGSSGADGQVQDKKGKEEEGKGEGEGDGEAKDKDEGTVQAWEKEVVHGNKKTRYEIESLRGFDFFPQTGHVEGVAVLNRVDS